MSKNVMKTVYVIRVYDGEWDKWVDICAVGSEEEAVKETTERRVRGKLTSFDEIPFKS